jgi:DNA mismatch endonuclease (patch repair protein)
VWVSTAHGSASAPASSENPASRNPRDSPPAPQNRSMARGRGRFAAQRRTAPRSPGSAEPCRGGRRRATPRYEGTAVLLIGVMSPIALIRNLSSVSDANRTSGSVTPSVTANSQTPPPSSLGAQATMRANRRRDTRPELALRRELHRRGLRFRVDFAPLAGVRCRADIVFTRSRVAVFVDGCFWHSCPEHGILPKANGEWWREKLEGNVSRDRRNDRALLDAGWHVIRVWEHDSVQAAADVVCETL